MPTTSPLRLTLISHGLTDAVRAARFAGDEPLLESALKSLPPNAIGRFDHALSGPEARARQSAAALGLDAETEPRLADIDHGSWAGSTMADVAEADLARWLTDPASAPHGGESITALIARVGAWMAALEGPGRRIVAVTHPAVARGAILCALDAPASAFWRIDIAPATRTVLHGRAGRWTLRTTSAPLAG